MIMSLFLAEQCMPKNIQIHSDIASMFQIFEEKLDTAIFVQTELVL